MESAKTRKCFSGLSIKIAAPNPPPHRKAEPVANLRPAIGLTAHRQQPQHRGIDRCPCSFVVGVPIRYVLRPHGVTIDRNVVERGTLLADVSHQALFKSAAGDDEVQRRKPGRLGLRRGNVFDRRKARLVERGFN